jgi:hypothetical protein
MLIVLTVKAMPLQMVYHLGSTCLRLDEIKGPSVRDAPKETDLADPMALYFLGVIRRS